MDRPGEVIGMLSHVLPEPEPLRRVVVLGSRGFVGSALLDALKAHAHESRGVPRHEVDLADPASVDRLQALLEPGDSVVVAAALTPDKGRDVATLMQNLRMAESLVRVLSDKPCAHVVYLSSDAVYDGQESLISEQSAASPSDLYSLMHVARERMLGHVTQAKGIPFCVLRPVAIFGAADTHNSYGPNRFMRSALRERRIQVFGAGEEKRDHIYIADVVAAIELALLHRSTGVLNLASGRSMSFADLAARIRELAGTNVAIESLPRSGKVTHRHFDATALAKSFPGLKLTALEDGLAQTTRSLREMSA